MKKFLTVVLVSAIVFSNTLSILASPLPSNEGTEGSVLEINLKEQYKNVVSSNIKKASYEMNNNYVGDFGAYFNMYHLMRYSKYLSYAMGDELKLDFSDQEILFYYNQLCKFISDYNEKFENFKIEGFEVDSSPNVENLKNFCTKLVNDKSVEYLEKVVTANAEPTFDIRLYQDTLRIVYRMLGEVSNYKKDISEIWISGKIEGNKFFPSEEKPPDYLDVEDINKTLNESKYKDLLLKAQSFDQKQTEISLDALIQDKGYTLEQLAFVEHLSDADPNDLSWGAWTPSQDKSDESVYLRSSYLAMLSASSVYKPFISHVGDPEAIESLRSIGGDTSDTLVEVFNNIKDIKKPLYFTSDRGIFSKDLKNSGSYREFKGSSQRFTLGDLVESISKEKSIMAFTVKGQFRQSESDSSRWEFYLPTNPNTKSKQVFGKSGANLKDTGLVIPADEKISTDNYTRAVFEFGPSWGNPATTLLMLVNSYKDLKSTSLLKEREKETLYITSLGDIVLSDGLVILPASANPVLYDMSGNGYNPYTAAFLNSYPRLALSTNNITTSNFALDIGKYILMYDKSKLKFDDPLEALKSGKNYPLNSLLASKLTGGNELKINKNTEVISTFNPLFMALSDKGYSSYFNQTDVHLSSTSFIKEKLNNDTFILEYQDILVNGNTLFPYYVETDEEFKTASIISKNMYWSYFRDVNLEPQATANSTLRSSFIYENILLEGLQGNKMSDAYNVSITIKKFLDKKSTAFEDLSMSVANSVLKLAKQTRSVVGIQDVHENGLWGIFVGFLQKYYMYIISLSLAFFIIKFARRGSLSYVFFMGGLLGVILFAYIKILPLELPNFYNKLVQLISEESVYSSLLYRTEMYSNVYDQSQKFEEKDGYDGQTASLTLYKLSEDQLTMIANNLGIEVSDFTFGKKYILDQNAGVYLEGNCIKVNTDILFFSSKISGSYVLNDIGGYYQLSSDKLVSSNIDFYMPFFQIQDGFVETLNSMLKTYNIPRKTNNYLKGVAKDSYIVHSYMGSIPFLYPNDFSEVQGMGTDEYNKLLLNFPEPLDFLNLGELIHLDDPLMQDTLWFQTMKANRYWQPDLEFSKKKREQLITYVNYQTRRFMIQNRETLSMVSDETLIKVISLYATTLFNLKISGLEEQVYPQHLNQEDLSVSDLYLATLADDTSKFILQDLDVTYYIFSKFGVGGLWVLTVMMISTLILTFLTNNLIIISYILLGFILTIKFVMDKPIYPTIKGYCKFTGFVLFIQTSQICVLNYLPMRLNTSSGVLTLLMACNIVLVYVLVNMCLAWKENFFNFGNNKYLKQFDYIQNVYNSIKETLNTSNFEMPDRETLLSPSVSEEFPPVRSSSIQEARNISRLLDEYSSRGSGNSTRF